MNELMQKVQQTEIEILDIVAAICEKNHLKYSLAYGTLIGAVRHKGFIPWDDDIDLMMLREDYDKLYELWGECAPEGYVLETEDNTTDLPINHMKIRKDHTTFIQDESEKNKKYHKGIFIDIFPADRRAPGKSSQIIQYTAFMLHLLYNRGHPSGAKGIQGLVERVLLCVPRKWYRPLSRRFGVLSRKWNKEQTELLFPCAAYSCRLAYPADMFDHLIKMEFNKKMYNVFKEYDNILRIEYGDYMQLPPNEERVWAHHPLIVDFEHNYEEL